MSENGQFRLEDVEPAIIALVEPYVGAHMAKSAAALHRKRLGLAGQHLTRAQVESLCGRWVKALKVLIGAERTADLEVRMRSSVGL